MVYIVRAIPQYAVNTGSGITLPDTNSSPLKIGQNPKGEDHLPTIHFQVLLLIVSGRVVIIKWSYNHQEFQVPKMEVLNLIRLFWRWVFPYISRIHTAYIGEYLHFRYLKCLVI